MLSPVKWAEVCFTSAKTGQRCTKVGDGLRTRFFHRCRTLIPQLVCWVLRRRYVSVSVQLAEEDLRGHGAWCARSSTDVCMPMRLRHPGMMQFTSAELTIAAARFQHHRHCTALHCASVSILAAHPRANARTSINPPPSARAESILPPLALPPYQLASFQLFDLVDEVAVQHRRRVKTSVLNEVSGGCARLSRLRFSMQELVSRHSRNWAGVASMTMRGSTWHTCGRQPPQSNGSRKKSGQVSCDAIVVHVHSLECLGERHCFATQLMPRDEYSCMTSCLRRMRGGVPLPPRLISYFQVLRDAVLWQAPPSKKSSGASQGKIYYCNQARHAKHGGLDSQTNVLNRCVATRSEIGQENCHVVCMSQMGRTRRDRTGVCYGDEGTC